MRCLLDPEDIDESHEVLAFTVFSPGQRGGTTILTSGDQRWVPSIHTTCSFSCMGSNTSGRHRHLLHRCKGAVFFCLLLSPCFVFCDIRNDRLELWQPSCGCEGEAKRKTQTLVSHLSHELKLNYLP